MAKNLKQVEIKPITHPIDTEIKIPASKSFTHRAFIIAGLADGDSKITHPLIAEDTVLTLKALKMMGVRAEKIENGYLIHGVAGKPKAPDNEIMLNNSGTSLRLLTSVAALADGEIILTGDLRMCERPVKDLTDALYKLGVKSQYLKNQGYPPVKIFSSLKGGKTQMSGNTSSQYFSSVLISSPYAEEDVEIIPTTHIKSRPYIDLTVEMMERFGVDVEAGSIFRVKSGQTYQATDYMVEGDFSSASYFFAVVAVLGGSIRVLGLNKNSRQGDRSFLRYLSMMGCKVTYADDSIKVEHDLRGPLKGIDVDMKNSPDIVQTLAIVACFAASPTTIRNIGHLKHKETDRIESTATELRKIGATVETTADTMIICPLKEPRPATIETYNDHRMCMSFSIAGLKIPGIIIKNPGCVKKSFPNFFDMLNQIYI
ncbi:MAG: 3-phosphoshikimate 1-carboxyvinyltransferase [Candidatus Hodarchaeota archaeon]